MTEAQAKFLRKVLSADPTRRFVTNSMAEMMAEISCHLHDWIMRDLHAGLFVTPAGLAALAEHEERTK